jgi:hypothetical protein
MGQYYKPVNLNKKEHLYAHEYQNGLKLMEHSYIGNRFMNAVENLLIPANAEIPESGRWYQGRIVWAGDYADAEPDNEDGYNLYSLMEKANKIQPPSHAVNPKYHYLTNHTKKQVVDLTAVSGDEHGFKIHPLSLFTAEGNGQGGGDFRGDDPRVGTWARDSISLEEQIPEGYELVDGQFEEEW